MFDQFLNNIFMNFFTVLIGTILIVFFAIICEKYNFVWGQQKAKSLLFKYSIISFASIFIIFLCVIGIYIYIIYNPVFMPSWNEFLRLMNFKIANILFYTLYGSSILLIFVKSYLKEKMELD